MVRRDRVLAFVVVLAVAVVGGGAWVVLTWPGPTPEEAWPRSWTPPRTCSA